MSTAERFVPPPQLATFMVGSLLWSGFAVPNPGPRLQQAVQWYAALLGVGLEGLPFAVVYDLGSLLLEGPSIPLAMTDWYQEIPEEERSVRGRYGSGFLCAIAEQPWFLQAHDIIAASPVQDKAVIYALERLLRPLNLPRTDGLIFTPSRLSQLPWSRFAREMGESKPFELSRRHLAEFSTWLEQDVETLRAAMDEEFRDFLGRSEMQGKRDLLSPVDLYELRHLQSLPTEERRLAARQLMQAELLIGDPEANLSNLREMEQVEVDLKDESSYPSGGLGSLSNKGAWENLAPTELIYMGQKGETDLFSVRVVEGGLLFYTRDEGVLKRKRRRVHLVLDLDSSFQFKFPEHPMSLDRIVEGMAARFTKDMLTLFEGDACQICLVVTGNRAREAAELLSIRFGDEMHRGEVTVEVVDESSSLDPMAWKEKGRHNYIVWAGVNPPFTLNRVRDLEKEKVRVVPVSLGKTESPAGLYVNFDSSLMVAIATLRDDLMTRILGCG